MIPVCSAAYFRLLCCTLCFGSRRYRCQIIRRGHGCGCGCGRGGRSTTIRGATFGTRCSVFGPDVVGSARAKAKRAILPRQSKMKKSICFLRVREWTDDTGSTSVSEHPSRPFSLPLPFRARFPRKRKGFSKQRERENGRTEGESRKEQGTGDGKDRQKDRVGGRKWMIGQGTSISGVLEVSFLSTHPFSSC